MEFLELITVIISAILIFGIGEEIYYKLTHKSPSPKNYHGDQDERNRKGL